MSYPAAFCVKCKVHTDTMNKHTVVLSNNARALRGTCPVCLSENYKILPAKGKGDGKQIVLGAENETAAPTMLPATMIAQRFGHQANWMNWAVYLFFVMSCLVFGYVLSLRF